jgi:hypothetical protein
MQSYIFTFLLHNICHTEKTTQHAGTRNEEQAGANITTTTDAISENNRPLLQKQGRD